MEIISEEEARKRGLKRFFDGTSCTHGHVAERYVSTGACVACLRSRPRFPDAETQRQYWRDYRASHPEKREKDRGYQLARYQEDPDRSLAGQADWRSRNRDYTSSRYGSDEQFRLGRILRQRTKNVLFKNKPDRFSADVGCTGRAFREHIESQFRDGMTWENFGTFWVLDHQKPLSTFDLTDKSQFTAAAHYSNVQPLTVDEHKRKLAADRQAQRRSNDDKAL